MLADPMTASTNHKYKRLRLVSLLCAIKHEVQQLPKQSFPVVHGPKPKKVCPVLLLLYSLDLKT